VIARTILEFFPQKQRANPEGSTLCQQER